MNPSVAKIGVNYETKTLRPPASNWAMFRYEVCEFFDTWDIELTDFAMHLCMPIVSADRENDKVLWPYGYI